MFKLPVFLGCGPRLDENRNDVCDDEPWTPPVINLQRLYFPEILFCRHDDDDDIASCTVQQARSSGYDQWTNINDFKERFCVLKKSHDFYLQVGESRLALEVLGALTRFLQDPRV